MQQAEISKDFRLLYVCSIPARPEFPVIRKWQKAFYDVSVAEPAG